jgi:hypothetical protein
MKNTINKVAAISIETSGINKDDCNKGKDYQILSFGIIIADAKTFNPIDNIYGQVKWNGESIWNVNLEPMHGFTKEYLNENGVDEEVAAAIIGKIFFDHFETNPIILLGHNISTFGYWFIKNILDKYGIDLCISIRMLDTFTIGKTFFNLDNSKEIFSLLNRPEKMNSLERADACLQLFRIIKKEWIKLNE